MPYEVLQVAAELRALIEDKGWRAGDLLYNLTGGTKAMALAAYLVAAEQRAPFVYLESQDCQTLMCRYEFDARGEPRLSEQRCLPGLVSIDDYLRAYIGAYEIRGAAKEPFELALYEALIGVVDEVLPSVCLRGALEVDMVVRCGNQVEIIEAKTGQKARDKSGLDQLNTAAGREFLGTYTAKMLIVDRVWDKSRSNLRELAQARQISVIELPSYGESGQLSEEDRTRLQQTVRQRLGG